MDQASTIADVYDELAQSYDEYYSKPKFLEENIKVLESLTSHQLLDNKRVLDLGCGTGLLVDIAKEHISPSNYLGIDISENMLNQARKKHSDYKFLTKDLDELHTDVSQIPLGQYDSIISLFIPLNYISDPSTTIQHLKKLLAADGKIFLVWLKYPDCQKRKRDRFFDAMMSGVKQESDYDFLKSHFSDWSNITITEYFDWYWLVHNC